MGRCLAGNVPHENHGPVLGRGERPGPAPAPTPDSNPDSGTRLRINYPIRHPSLAHKTSTNFPVAAAPACPRPPEPQVRTGPVVCSGSGSGWRASCGPGSGCHSGSFRAGRCAVSVHGTGVSAYESAAWWTAVREYHRSYCR